MAKKKKTRRDTAELARDIVEQVTGGKLNGEPLHSESNECSGRKKNRAAVALSRLGASKGGKVRAAKLNDKQRSEIAKKAAEKRWGKKVIDDTVNSAPKLVYHAPIVTGNEVSSVSTEQVSATDLRVSLNSIYAEELTDFEGIDKSDVQKASKSAEFAQFDGTNGTMILEVSENRLLYLKGFAAGDEFIVDDYYVLPKAG